MKEKHPALLTLRAVTQDIAEEHAGTLNGGRLSPNTCNKHLNLLTLVFRGGEAQGQAQGKPLGEYPTQAPGHPQPARADR